MMNVKTGTPGGSSRKRKRKEDVGEEEPEALVEEVVEVPDDDDALLFPSYGNFKIAVVNGKEIHNEKCLSIIRLICFFLDKFRSFNVTGHFKLKFRMILKYYGMYDVVLDDERLDTIFRKVSRSEMDAGINVRPIFNVVSLSKELTNLSDVLKFNEWYANYLSPQAVAQYTTTTTILFSQKVFHILINLTRAVSEGNWDHVGIILSEIDFNPRNIAGNNLFYPQYINNLFSFRWPELFNVTFERILQLKIDPEEKCKYFEQALIVFKETCKFNPVITRNSFTNYLTSILVYGMANQQLDFVNRLLEFEIPNNFMDSEYYQQFKSYTALNDYIKVLKQSADDSSTDFRWPGIYQKLRSIVESAHNPSRMLIFIEPLVISSQFTDNQEDAMELIVKICCQSPSLLPYVADILNRCEEKRFVGPVISEVLQSTSENELFLSRFPLILYFVHQRSLNPNTVIKREDAEMHVRMLFEFLDHIQNRGFSEAWECFLVNLKVLYPFPEWILEEWNERRTWWKKFHKIPLDDGEDERKQVFDLLENREDKKMK